MYNGFNAPQNGRASEMAKEGENEEGKRKSNCRRKKEINQKTKGNEIAYRERKPRAYTIGGAAAATRNIII